MRIAKTPSQESKEIAFRIVTQHGDVLQDDTSLNGLIDDIAAALDAAKKVDAKTRAETN